MLSPSLGITKKIMSRGPQVLDMEYREPDPLELGPGGPNRGLQQRERRTFHQGQPGRPGPRGFCSFHHDVGTGRPMISARSPMTSSNILDVLEAVVCQVARVAGS
jgi:hypothetical protein